MQTKVFTIRFSELKDCFDDTELREFVKDKEILGLRDHFFMRHEIPYLTVIVNYNLPTIGTTEATTATAVKKERDESWKELLTAEDMPIFNSLRDWRAEISRRRGIPPYIVCNNRQLAEMVHQKMRTKNELSRIEGFGKNKIEDYGADIISLLRETKKTAPSEPETITGASQEKSEPPTVGRGAEVETETTVEKETT